MDQRDESFLKQCDIGSFLYKVTMGTGLEPTPKGAMVTGTVAHNVSLLAQYVSPVKKSESSRKELSGFFCVFTRMQSSREKNKSLQT